MTKWRPVGIVAFALFIYMFVVGLIAMGILLSIPPPEDLNGAENQQICEAKAELLGLCAIYNENTKACSGQDCDIVDETTKKALTGAGLLASVYIVWWIFIITLIVWAFIAAANPRKVVMVPVAPQLQQYQP